MFVPPEEFAVSDLRTLRDELRGAGLDSWQAAELIGAFLAQRGYGVSNDTARHAVMQMEATGCNLDCMRQELSRLALFV